MCVAIKNQFMLVRCLLTEFCQFFEQLVLYHMVLYIAKYIAYLLPCVDVASTVHVEAKTTQLSP